MLYDYLITAYKVIVGLITTDILVTIALCALGFYLLWIFVSLFASFERKFNSRCQNLIGLLRTNQINPSNTSLLDMKIEKLSSGFYFGWTKYKKHQNGKPSDYIKRSDALDVEITGGLLNHGKTLMRAYISLVTFVLFLFNFAYVGGENAITFMTFAESLVLPLVFYVIIKILYFTQNSIRQKMYRLDIESFYSLVDLLDNMFAAQQQENNVSNNSHVVITEQVAKMPEENSETAENEQSTENEQTASVEETAEENTQEETEPENKLDKYDIFKKKNIDVDKLMNETPKSDMSLPFINVDSDYVIKEEGANAAPDAIVNKKDDTATSILGGMMQNTSLNSKKNSNFIDTEKQIAEIDSEKIEEISNKTENKVEPEKVAEPEKTAETEKPQLNDEVNDISELKKTIEEVSNETKENEEKSSNDEQSQEKLEEEKQNIANVVSGFKANRSKLASGGVVIERNQPIAKRERVETTYNEQQPTYGESGYDTQSEINRLSADENTDDILTSLKSTPGAYDSYTTQYDSGMYQQAGYDQNYGYNPGYVAPVTPVMPNYGYMPDNQNYGAYQPNGYDMNNYANYNQNVYGQEDLQPQQEVQTKHKKEKIVRTKEDEPRPRSLRNSAKTSEKEDDDMAKRGRPKKQEVSETMIIANDKEFNEVLSRAEKLMRKSDEGLSESQSKRIEKELKMLMDAMNRYKEGK